jgi:hypothetical protein
MFLNVTWLVYFTLMEFLIIFVLPEASTTSLLVRDGIVATMEKIIINNGFTPNSKLRLSLNVINYLTKNSKNMLNYSQKYIWE